MTSPPPWQWQAFQAENWLPYPKLQIARDGSHPQAVGCRLRPGLPELAPGLPERLDRALVLRTEHSFCLQRLVVRTVLRGPNAAKSYPNLIPNPFLRQKKSPKNGMASRGLGKVR